MTKEALMKYMMGGKMPKAQNGITLDQVVVKDKKGAGVKSQGVVARGKSGEEFLAKRNELIASETAKLMKGKAPGYKPTDRERSDMMDRVRKSLYEQGYQEQGVIRKDTKERLSPEDEKYARERMTRR